MSQINLSESLKELTDMAEYKGRTDARTQVMDLISTFLTKPEVATISATEAISWIVRAIEMEFQFEQPGDKK
jgi:hypothetical protein